MPAETFGVHAFLNMLLSLLLLYARHQVNIDAHLSSEAKDAMHFLLSIIDAVREANPRGPEKTVQTNIGGSL